MLSNPEAKEIVTGKITMASGKSMAITIEDRDENLVTLHEVETYCNVAIGMIDKYIILDDPRQVEKFFICIERIRADLNYIRTKIEESNPSQSHIEGLTEDLDDLLKIL